MLTLVSADPSGLQYKASPNEPLKTQRFLGRLLLLVGVLVSVAFLVPVKAVPDFGHIRQSILSGRPITEFYHYSHQSRRLLGQCERLCIHLSLGSQYLADQSFLEQECYPGLAGGWIGVYTPLRNLVCRR